MKNRGFDAFKNISYFRWRNGRGRHAGTKGSGALTPVQKVGPLTVISQTVLKVLELEPPPFN